MSLIEARRVFKVYDTGGEPFRALAGVDLQIRSGEFVSIMGPSGSGKSTLLHLIGLLDTPSKGRIRILGEEASTLSKNRRARIRQRHLGFVFQAFHLLPRTSALQNVLLPMALAGVPRRERRPRAVRALEAVGLGDRIDHRPSELSGGQKQRVAIARALAMDPPILLADEPTGNLDSRTTRDIMSLFRQLNAQGKTIVQVTHDLNMARYGDRIVHVHDGRIVREERRPGPAAAASSASLPASVPGVRPRPGMTGARSA